MLKLALDMPMVVDDMEGTIDAAYSVLLKRLYVLDADGVVRLRLSHAPMALTQRLGTTRSKTTYT